MNPSLEKETLICNNPDELAHRAAEIFKVTAVKSVAEKGSFTVALSGGSTPRAAHRLLAEEPFVSGIPWDSTHFFWVDERCVPETDPANNFGAAKRDFLNKVPIPAENVHPMPMETKGNEGALNYRKELERFFKGSFPVFDLIYLGIGTDGHTASLFPGHRSVEEKEKWVVAVKGGNPNVDRITLAYPLLNNARHIVFLASGKGKAEIVNAIMEKSNLALPAQRVQPEKGKLSWLMDREASSLLPAEAL